MKKESVVIIILSILLAATNTAWVIYHFQLQQVEQTKDWIWVKTWSGTESTKTTEAFRITGEEWRISWSFSGYAEGARCEITVYEAYTDSMVKTLSLTYDINEGYLNLSSRFYLAINVYGSIDNWNVEVCEYK